MAGFFSLKTERTARKTYRTGDEASLMCSTTLNASFIREDPLAPIGYLRLVEFEMQAGLGGFRPNRCRPVFETSGQLKLYSRGNGNSILKTLFYGSEGLHLSVARWYRFNS